jgi:hypothetical protein
MMAKKQNPKRSHSSGDNDYKKATTLGASMSTDCFEN